MSKRGDDQTRFEDLLDSTRDPENNLHVDQAIELFAEELMADEGRAFEFAQTHARDVGKRFVRQRSEQIESGQLQILPDTIFALGDNVVCKARDAVIYQFDRWWSVQQKNFSDQANANSIKARRVMMLRPIIIERNCSVYDAELFLEKAEDQDDTDD